MEAFDLHILGCGSALPTSLHYPTSQVLNVREKLFMIDCGEGAQMQFRKSKLKFSRLNHIFISHFHGDHCFGLPGLVSTLGLLGRTADLHIYLPEGVDEAFKQMMNIFCYGLQFNMVYHPFDATQRSMIYEDRSLTVETIPLKHRIPCAGFLFREKPGLRHIVRDMCDFHRVPVSYYGLLKVGEDFVNDDGDIIPNGILTKAVDPARSYAYCSDTAYIPELKEQLHDVDLLFHEATFSDDDMPRAIETFHSTAGQAATVARDAGVKKLMIGHYSARYTDNSILLNQARHIFPDTMLSNEGMTYRI